MQVLDNEGHPDGKIHKHRAGDLYDLIASSSEPVHGVGEWNDAEIKLDHGKLTLLPKWCSDRFHNSLGSEMV